MAKLLRHHRSDTGSSIVFALVVVFVVFGLGATWIALAEHQSDASASERRRQRAFDAAHEGLVAAQSALATKTDVPSGLVTVKGSEAQFEITKVETPAGQPTMRLIQAVGYAPSKTAARRTVRTLEQTVELDRKPQELRYAIFAQGTTDVWNNATIVGDVYAKEHYYTKNNLTITGTLYARSSVDIDQNTQIFGGIVANGDIDLSKVDNSTGTASSRTRIILANTARVNVQAPVVDCAKVAAGYSCSQSMPPTVVGDFSAPTFTGDRSGFVTKTGAEFVALAASPLAGSYEVQGPVAFDKHATLRASGPLTIYVNGDITELPATVESTVPGDPVDVRIITTGTVAKDGYSFTSKSDVDLLLLAGGDVTFKNNADIWGAVYAGGDVDAKNSLTIRYRSVDNAGFSWPEQEALSYFIRNVSLREVNS